MDVQKLAIDLTEARTEDDVIAILTREGVWSDYAYWRPFGDNDNNFGSMQKFVGGEVVKDQK